MEKKLPCPTLKDKSATAVKVPKRLVTALACRSELDAEGAAEAAVEDAADVEVETWFI
jgi:hypothetical protein